MRFLCSNKQLDDFSYGFPHILGVQNAPEDPPDETVDSCTLHELSPDVSSDSASLVYPTELLSGFDFSVDTQKSYIPINVSG